MEVIFAVTAGTIIFGWLAKQGIESYSDSIGLLGILSMIGAMLGAMFLVFLSWTWVVSEHKASLINRQLGTDYTREDIMYASGYIEEVRVMHRQRIELNGDLFRGEDK